MNSKHPLREGPGGKQSIMREYSPGLFTETVAKRLSDEF